MEFRPRALALALCIVAANAAADEAPLRVCADANHLPYSNAAGEGFENHLATLVADAMGRSLETTWWPQRRGFLRNTLDAGRCDVVIGVPASLDRVLTSEPYYRSCYAWVFPPEAGSFGALDAPGLAQRRIGVHLIGDDYANSPPAQALAEHGIIEHVVGYSVFGDYGSESPLRAPVDAVARGEIDAALLWGPIAGYFANQQTQRLSVRPVPHVAGHVFGYSIAMGVRRKDVALRDQLNEVLIDRAPEVAELLDRYRVPRCADAAGPPIVATAADAEAPQAQAGPGGADAVAAGAKLFKKLNCYACHGAAGGGGMGPDLTDEQWKTGDGNDASLLTQILEGRAAMPPYKALIGETEARQLIAFIRTLYRGDPTKKTW